MTGAVNRNADWELSYWQRGANAARSGKQPIVDTHQEMCLTKIQAQAWLNGYNFALTQMEKQSNIWWANASRITQVGIHESRRKIDFIDPE